MFPAAIFFELSSMFDLKIPQEPKLNCAAPKMLKGISNPASGPLSPLAPILPPTIPLKFTSADTF